MSDPFRWDCEPRAISSFPDNGVGAFAPQSQTAEQLDPVAEAWIDQHLDTVSLDQLGSRVFALPLMLAFIRHELSAEQIVHITQVLS